MMIIYNTLSDLKSGAIFRAAHGSTNEIFVLTNRYILDNEKPWRKIHECVSLRDGKTSRFLETMPVIEYERRF